MGDPDDEPCIWATREREEAISKARAKGHLNAEEKDKLVEGLSKTEQEELDDVLQKLKTKLRHSAYRAASCDDGTGYDAYTQLQHAREELKMCWLMKEYKQFGEGYTFSQYCSILRIQCLCRWYIARCVYRDLLSKRRESVTSEFLDADQAEAALLIQGMVRRTLAKKELCRRRSSILPAAQSSSAHPAQTGERAATAPAAQGKAVPAGLEGRHIHLPSACSQLVPNYTVHDVSNVPITDEEIRGVFNELTSTSILSKATFMKYYRSLETYGVEHSDSYIDGVLQQFNTTGNPEELSYQEFSIVMLRLSQR